MWRLVSSFLYVPLLSNPLLTAPHPELEASDWITMCGKEFRMGDPFARGRLSTHQLRSSRAWWSRGTSALLTTWKWVLLLFKCWIPKRTAILQEVNFSIIRESWVREATCLLTKWQHYFWITTTFLSGRKKHHVFGVHDDSQDFEDLYREEYGFCHVYQKSQVH